MTDKEIQSLIECIQQRIANPISPEEALADFVEVGILNPDSSFTEPYQTPAQYITNKVYSSTINSVRNSR